MQGCRAPLRRAVPGQVIGLEGEDGADFRANVIPLAHRSPIEERVLPRRSESQSACAIERFLRGEGDPIVEFVQQLSGEEVARHAPTAETANVARKDCVVAIVQIEGPTSVPPGGIGVGPARKRQSQVQETAL